MLSRHDEVALRVLLDSLDRLPTVVSQEPVDHRPHAWVESVTTVVLSADELRRGNPQWKIHLDCAILRLDLPRPPKPPAPPVLRSGFRVASLTRRKGAWTEGDL